MPIDFNLSQRRVPSLLESATVPGLRHAFMEGAIGAYFLVVGLGMLGLGVRRQTLVARARDRCTRALSAAETAQQRMRVLYHEGVHGLPDLSRQPRTSLSCEELLAGTRR
jgi:hypothetical protein